MKKLIKLFSFLFLIIILSSSSAFAKNDVNSSVTESLVVAPVVTTPVYLCQNSTAVPLTATPSVVGATLKWYTVITGGTALPGAPTPITTTVGSTTYYVTETIAGVESTPRTPIVVNVVGDNGATLLNFRCDPSQVLPADQNSSVMFDWSNNPLINNNSYN